ncbi:SIR2 family protein [Mesorhizobium sp. VK23B]|uniref:SIR2 family protein n=1 Tax=Mesorhizobium dulcispinae TaxID=3072316 RepID=A0ABU4XGZ6_9HYPH|nr:MULTISPECIES: SIR2 family protein [unclassified Mesorhizobium]MDX8467702.1 SIR2 family protein [Mesorhizobium sp. VK23B]MDX8474040.1 SIR2 family protein [Mesorhizobium sp. VK23A]
MAADIDELTQLAFSVHESPGVFALLVGSGISRAAGIPTGWEVTLDLVRRVAKGQGVDDQADWAKWYRDVNGEEPNYSNLVEQLGGTPAERRAILHSYIEPTEQDRQDGRKVPTRAHHAIADLVASGHFRVIVTTNFDRLLENALRERSIEPTVISSVDALAGAEPITHSACYILKLHGDYRDARILNTDEELRGYPAQYDSVLDRIFDEYGLIVSGWSGEWDHALRSAMLRAPNRRYSMFWSTRGKLGAGAAQLVSHRKARVIQGSGADEFFVGLADRVKTLDATRRQNPASIDLLIASVKRLMVSSEDRIRLQDVVAEEVARILQILAQPDLGPPTQWDAETVKQYALRYESALESLASVCGVLGRWGDGADFELVLDTLKSLEAHAATITTGNTHYIAFRSYPTVLTITCYGVGLVRAGRFAVLHRLLNATLKREHKEPARICDSLFLWAWEGGSSDGVWRAVLNKPNHLAPLSEHLFNTVQRWGGGRFLTLTADASLVFERYEVLASLTHFEQHPLSDAQQALSQENNFIFMPVGRSGWNSKNSEQIFAELESPETKAVFAKAGFAKDGDARLSLFKKNFFAIARRMRWG